MDNVIDLEDKKQLINQQENSEDDELSVEMIKRGIKGGMSILEKQISIWSDLDFEENPQTNDLAYRSLKGVKNTLQSLNQLVDMIQHDTVGVIQNLETQMVSHWTYQAHLQTLIEVLKKNDFITEEQLEQTWNELIPKSKAD